MSDEIVYFELPGHDAAVTQRFWSSLSGWTFGQGVQFSLLTATRSR